jgi:hypothetical protein
MRRLLFNTISALVVFSVPACGRSSSGIQIKMDPLHSYMTTIAVEKLQKESANSAVNFNNDSPYVVIEVVPFESLSRFGNGVLGVALVGGNPCKIQIADRTFLYNQDWINSVIWHEIGHCFYLEHTDDYTDIMYKYANPLSWYSKDTLNSFFRRLYDQTH